MTLAGLVVEGLGYYTSVVPQQDNVMPKTYTVDEVRMLVQAAYDAASSGVTDPEELDLMVDAMEAQLNDLPADSINWDDRASDKTIQFITSECGDEVTTNIGWSVSEGTKGEDRFFLEMDSKVYGRGVVHTTVGWDGAVVVGWDEKDGED